MKKKLMGLGLIALALSIIVGCEKNNQETKREVKTEETSTDVSSSTASDSSTSSSSSSVKNSEEKEGFEKVGGEGHGYVVIPDTWVDFKDPQAPEDIQYMVSNVIITLGMPLEKVTEDKLKEMAGSLVEFNESRGALGSELSEANVNGSNAQVVLNDFGKNFYLKTYCFVLEDITHIVSIEGYLEDVEEAGKWIEASFTAE